VLTNQSPAVLLGDEDEDADVVDVLWVEREGRFGLLFGLENVTIDGYRLLLVCWWGNI
jgi:hypothetical protein